MSNQIWRNSLIRFIVILLFQIFLFKQIAFGLFGENISFVLVYPVFILMLPFGVFEPIIILCGFAMGLATDFIYDTLGIHAAAATFTAFVRPRVFKLLSPARGYDPKLSPVPRDMGWYWFNICLGLILFINLFAFFLLQTFAPQFFFQILMKAIASTLVSFPFIILGIVILNPRS
ncbi:MAG: hypothetical protein AAF741_09050 [Bacteroidota bacterium]